MAVPLKTIRHPVWREAPWTARLLFGSFPGGWHLLSGRVGGPWLFVLLILNIRMTAKWRIACLVTRWLETAC